MSYLCLDTNILLLDAHNLLTLGQTNTIVLPEVVLDELDSKKSGLNELAFQAREFGRLLTKATKIETVRDGNLIINKLQLNSINIEVVSLKTYPDYSDSEPNIINDRKIIEVALSYQATNRIPLTFMSNDVMCRLRADSVGLTTIDLKQVELNSIEFTRSIQVDSATFVNLHNSHILDVVPDHKPENFNYTFVDAFSGQVKLANIRNGLIDILGKETETELRKQDAPPQNSGQLFLSRAIQNPLTNVVICEAMAGSGKTVTAISNAVQLVKKGKYSSITYIRASVDDVEKAEEIGFLSGNDEKVQVYLHPLDDTIDFLVRQNHKDSKLRAQEYEDMIAEKCAEYKAKYRITGMIGLGLRGRTFTNTIAIIDECQNMSKSSLQKVLTRFGKDCKVILIGSQKQIDNAYLTKYTNGLATIMDSCKHESDLVKLHAVPLQKVLRSSVAEWAEKLFSNIK